MSEMVIDRYLVIEEADTVLSVLKKMSGMSISGIETVKRFVNTEKNTRFYLDSNLSSYMTDQQDCVYAWIDSGFTDRSGEPLFISLLKNGNVYRGYIVGTIESLANSAKNYFRLSYDTVCKKVQKFERKYKAKADERVIKHILDEQRYLVECLHDFGTKSEFAAKLEALNIVFDEDVTEEIIGDQPEDAKDMKTEGFNPYEEEITVSILLEQMESMQKYMDEIVAELKKVSTESKARIEELEKKNDEYKKAMVLMREYSDNSEAAEALKDKENLYGHDLLGNHDKILVIGGQELRTEIMYGIAKSHGFEKKDFEFVEYDKAKDFTDRIRRNGKYGAIIFGACPHKTTACGGYTSALERFRQTEGMPYTVDARSKSGNLKVTKESFRNAILDITDHLMMKRAS